MEEIQADMQLSGKTILTFQLEKTFSFEVLTLLADREGVAGSARPLRLPRKMTC